MAYEILSPALCEIRSQKTLFAEAWFFLDKIVYEDFLFSTAGQYI